MVTEDLGQRFARVYAIRAPLLLNSAILLERLRLRLRLLSLRLRIRFSFLDWLWSNRSDLAGIVLRGD